MGIIEEAYEIAKRDLRACYAPNGIHAGHKHFDDYWARDSFFASLGAIDIGDMEIVKKNLMHFIEYQKPNGQFPLRIGTFNIALKLLGIETKDRTHPRYMIDKVPFVPPVDQNSLFIIALKAYIEKTKNMAFLRDNYLSIQKAMLWNFENDKDRDLLIEEGYFANWADSVKKSGEVLYTNVCHYKACADFADISRMLNNLEDARQYKSYAEKIKARINENYWNGRYYIDWITHKKKFEYFSTSGNLLAVAFGLASQKQAISIEKCIDEFGINNPVPSRTNYPRMPSSYITLSLRLFLLGDYHNFDLSWLWLGSFDVIAKWKTGMRKEAKQLLEKIAAKICEFNGVYEIYSSKGKPVKRLFYKSEFPFAWSSGLFIHACHLINGVK